MKKNHLWVYYLYFTPVTRKFIRVMKLSVLLTCVLSLNLMASVYSQNARFDLDIKDQSVRYVLKEIEKDSKFRFFYNDDFIDLEKKLTFSISDQSIDDLMSLVLANTDVSYRVLDNNFIVISPRSLLQQHQVTGTVTDKNGPIPGANVVVTGTTTGTITDSNGKYSLVVPPGSKSLTFTFIGMEPQVVTIGTLTQINVTMVETATALEEVVVIGYGTMKKKDLTGSLASVKSDDLTAFPTTNVTQALQGRSAGVQVTQNSGAPGSAIQVRIRGMNSIQGSNEPLWIIDGFPGNQNMLNSSDIESMEILKDASATAIYGSNGANGVIIITTKRGKAGTTVIDYDGSYSVQSVRKKLDLLNATEYMKFQNIQQLNDTKKEYFTQDQINNAGNGTDWQDMLYRSAPVTDHTLRVSGGNEKTQFSLSAGVFDQQGIIINSYYKRKTLKMNFNHDVSKKLSVFYIANISRLDTKNPYESGGFRGGSLLSAIISASPSNTPYNVDGSYVLLKTAYPFSSDFIINPIAYVNEVSNKSYANMVMANLGFTVKPIEGLSIKVTGNFTNNETRSDNYTSLKYPASIGSAGISEGNVLTLNGEGIINYNKTFNSIHNLSITGGSTYEQTQSTSLGMWGSGFLSDATQTYNIGAASNSGTPSSSFSKYQLLSFLGRANYSYKDKYLATISLRADGSSRYSEGDKWGYFPSGALAYRLSEEKFMKAVKFISDLKLRVGYGETGSTAIPPYYTLDMLSSGKIVLNDALYNSYSPGTRLPADLKWETTSQINAGIDVASLKQRIRLAADYYVKNTHDLLNTVKLPSSLGYTTTIQNIGEIQNKGFEFQLDANILEGGFIWNVSGNIAFNKNKVIKLYGGQDILGSALNITIIQDYLNLIREGLPMSSFYGYQENGYDASGKIVYKDINGDNTITTADRSVIGNPNPDFFYGLNSSMSWKNFEFNFFIQGIHGNDIYCMSAAEQTLDMGMGFNTVKEQLYDHWTPSTPNAKYPVVSKSTTARISDRFVFDGSYLRVKDIQIAYNIPVNKLRITWLKRGQVYISGQNLITITNYPWQDPEINSFGGSTSITQGIDQYSYPVSKSLTFGLKLSF